MNGISFFAGIIGLALLLVAFFLDAFSKRFDNARILYVLNCLGSGLLAYYAWKIGSAPFVILEAVWFVVALIKMIKR